MRDIRKRPNAKAGEMVQITAHSNGKAKKALPQKRKEAGFFALLRSAFQKNEVICRSCQFLYRSVFRNYRPPTPLLSAHRKKRTV